MLSTMASSVSGSEDSPDIHKHKSDPPDLDYEGPSSRSRHEETNGNEIPELIATATPTRNRRKRRKGIPTRVEPTVIHKDNDSSSESDSVPPFLLPNSPARMAPKDASGSDGGFGPIHMRSPMVEADQSPVGKISQSLADRGSSPSIQPKSLSGSKTTPRSRKSSVNSKSHTKSAAMNKAMPDAESSEDVSGMVFGYTKVTSSIATTSRGAKRVKLIVYMCNFCNFKTTDNAAFWEHSVLHLFTCPHCPFKAFNRQNLVSHMEKEHPGQVPEEYINICEISVIDMRVTRNITSDPPPPGRGVRLDSGGFSSPGMEDGSGSAMEVPPKLVNPRPAQKPRISDATPPKAHGGQKPTDLKFRCDFCPYITSIFSAFMTHQKEHTAEVEKKTRTGPPTSGKLKSLLVGRSITPPPPGTKTEVSPKTGNNTTLSPAHKPTTVKQSQKLLTTPVLKVPQVPSKSTVTPTSQDSSLAVDSLLQTELSKHAKCPICNFVLRSLSELEAHIHLCHQSRLTVTGSTTVDSCKNGSDDYTWCCIYCTAKSDTKLGVVTHIKANHPGEKIRVWRWANKTANSSTETSDSPANPEKKVKTEPTSQTSDNEDSSLKFKQVVSSTIDNVYGSPYEEGQSSPLSLAKPVLSNQSLLKIPDVTNTSDIMEGKCAITVRKVTPTSTRQMRSLITGGLVTSPGKPVSAGLTPVTTTSPPPSLQLNIHTPVLDSVDRRKGPQVRGPEPMPELCLQPPLLTPSYLDMLPDSSETQEYSMDLSMKKNSRTQELIQSEVIKSEPMSPSSDGSNELDFKTLFMKDQDDMNDLNNLDVDVEVRKESLVPADHISYDEDQRLHCCRHCTYQTRSYGHIVDHISTHTGMKTWSCSYCSYRSNRRHDLLRHVQKNHPGSKLKMIRNVPYSSKFSYPLKMSQRVSVARAMVAKKKTTVPAARRLHQITSQKLLRKSLQVRRPSIGAVSPTKAKSPTKVDKWQPPPTVEFWECPICTRRGSMEVMERHIPIVHPEKIRKRISKKEIMAPSLEHLIMSARLSERRDLKIDMIPLEKMPFANQDAQDLPLLHDLPEKLTMMPQILMDYNKAEGVDDSLLAKELEEQRNIEMKEEISWLSGLNHQESDSEASVDFMGTIASEEYRCQYCTFSDQSLYTIRKHLIWKHPDMLLKCVDLRAKPPLTPRVVHMCHCCTFHSVSPYNLLSHYSRNPKHGPGNESDNNNTSSDEDLPVLEPACPGSSSADASNEDSLPALEKKSDKKMPGIKFLSRPLGKPSRNVAMKRVTKSSKNSVKFLQGTQLQCRYCKEFKMYDSTIMKDHLLTEHCGQPAIAIDVRSRELRRTSRVFFCPILECNFTEYGPDALVKHLNNAHPDTAFDALIIQICPKENRADKNSNTNSNLPELEPPKSKSSKKDHYAKKEKRVISSSDEGIQRGGTMPKTTSELTMKNRYWCAYCDAHSSCIDKVKAHFLENHMENKAQLIDARARVLRKKSRLFFCWNVTCNFTTFLENQATLHEQSQSCLSNFAPDEYESTKVESHSSGVSSPAGTPEYSEPNSGGSRMFQCLYCSLMTSSRVNMLSHMAAEHACTSGGYSEINTEFNKDGDIIMNVGGDAEVNTLADD